MIRCLLTYKNNTEVAFEDCFGIQLPWNSLEITQKHPWTSLFLEKLYTELLEFYTPPYLLSKSFLLRVFFKILGHLEEHTQTNAPNFPISLEWSSSKFTPNAGRTFKRINKFLFSLKSPKNHNSLKPASNYEENLETISKHQF